MEYKIPGVYSKVDASAALKSLSANDYVIGVVAKGGTGKDTELFGKAYAPYSFEDAQLKYGTDSNIVKIMDTAIGNGGAKFIVVMVDDTDPLNANYQAALDALELEEAVDIVVSDIVSPTDYTKIKNHVEIASQNRKERIAIVGFDAGLDITAAVTNAGSINSSRIAVAYPNLLNEDGVELSGMYTAAAIAGQLAAEADPSMPMTGVELRGFFGVAKKLKDTEMTTLIDAGVIPLESRNGAIRIVRCITTYTKDTQGGTDITWQEITTIRISDYVFKDMREGLARKFSRSKQNADTRDAIRSEVMTRLLTYQELEYVENVEEGDAVVAINPTNPLRNDVKFKYDVTGPLNVIHLTGYLVV